MHCGGPRRVSLDFRDCPKDKCLFCRSAPLVYPFHLQCLSTLHQLFHGREILEDTDWRLRCAEALSRLTVQDKPSPISLIEALHALVDRKSNLLLPEAPLNTLLQNLCKLPIELREIVFSFMLEHPGGQLLFNANISTVLQDLVSWPEKRYRRLSSHGSLFARWVTCGSMSCLAGLYDHRIRGSSQLEPVDAQGRLLVIYWRESRITGLDFIGFNAAVATANANEHIQILRIPTDGDLWVTTKVVEILLKAGEIVDK